MRLHLLLELGYYDGLTEFIANNPDADGVNKYRAIHGIYQYDAVGPDGLSNRVFRLVTLPALDDYGRANGFADVREDLIEWIDD
jgi:hypothetical protein